MIAVDKKRVEQALEQEHRTSQRQVLLRQLWRLNQLVSETEQASSENVAESPARQAERRDSSG